MKLTEILNTKVDYDVLHATSTHFVTKAKIGDRYITFVAINSPNDEGGDEWDVEFIESDEHGKKKTFDVTGSGNEFQVFSMVKDSLKELIDRYSPGFIAFTASKDGGKDTRADLYERLLKKFKLTGYSIKRDRYEKTGDVFRLIKND